jgi:hypothetical protein
MKLNIKLFFKLIFNINIWLNYLFFLFQYLLFSIFIKYFNLRKNSIGVEGAASLSNSISALSKCPLTSFSICLA